MNVGDVCSCWRCVCWWWWRLDEHAAVWLMPTLPSACVWQVAAVLQLRLDGTWSDPDHVPELQGSGSQHQPVLHPHHGSGMEVLLGLSPRRSLSWNHDCVADAAGRDAVTVVAPAVVLIQSSLCMCSVEQFSWTFFCSVRVDLDSISPETKSGMSIYWKWSWCLRGQGQSFSLESFYKVRRTTWPFCV